MAEKGYGYIADSLPTQSNTANTGVFSMSDIQNLIEEDKWTTVPLEVPYFVQGGGGKGGTQRGGGGGAGGDQDGTLTSLTAGTGSTVTVGGSQSASVFASITANAGGHGGGFTGAGSYTGSGNGGSGVVIIRLNPFFGITIGAGLTYDTWTASGENYYLFKAGTDTVTIN